MISTYEFLATWLRDRLPSREEGVGLSTADAARASEGSSDLTSEPSPPVSSFVRCPFCDHILPPGSVVPNGSTPGGPDGT